MNYEYKTPKGKVVGPFPETSLVEHARMGFVTAETAIRAAGTDELWHSATRLPLVAAAIERRAASVPQEAPIPSVQPRPPGNMKGIFGQLIRALLAAPFWLLGLLLLADALFRAVSVLRVATEREAGLALLVGQTTFFMEVTAGGVMILVGLALRKA